MEPLTDLEILALYQAGQAGRGGDELVRAYRPVAAKHLCRLMQKYRDWVRITEQADLLRDLALTRVHRRLQEKKVVISIGGLVCQAAHFELLTAVIQERRRKLHEVLAVELRGEEDDSESDDFLERLPRLESVADDLTKQSDVYRSYLDCLEGIATEAERHTVRMHLEHELTFDELAAMKIPKRDGGVYRRGGIVRLVGNVLARLRECLKSKDIHPV